MAGRALIWIAICLALLLAPLAILIAGRMPPGKAFLWDFSMALGFAGIVGGIGITPLMSMMRSMADRGDQRPVFLFYANKAWDSVIYREEIESLSSRLALTIIHVLEKPPADWGGEKGFVTREVLARHLPEAGLRDLYYFLCGRSR